MTGFAFFATGLYFFLVTTPFIVTIPSFIMLTVFSKFPNKFSIPNPHISIYSLHIHLLSISTFLANPFGKSHANKYWNVSIHSEIFFPAVENSFPSLILARIVIELSIELCSNVKTILNQFVKIAWGFMAIP